MKATDPHTGKVYDHVYKPGEMVEAAIKNSSQKSGEKDEHFGHLEN